MTQTMTPSRMIDVARARAETPGCEKILHLNNAGSSLVPEPVLRVQLDYLREEAEGGGYEVASVHGADFERVYGSLARLIGADADEIAILESSTRAWNEAFHSVGFERGDRVLTGVAEYASNYLAYLQAKERWGIEIEVVSNDESGQISVDELRKKLSTSREGRRVRLIAVTHVPTNGGLVNPAEEIGRAAQEAGVLYLLDACQSVGQMPIDVRRIGCDFLSTTSRKFLRGPRGVGFLYSRRESADHLRTPFVDLHSARWVAADRFEPRLDARRFEKFEMSYAARLAFGSAADYALGWGLDAIRDRVRFLADSLRSKLEVLPGCRVRDLGTEKCGIVTFSCEGMEPERLQRELQRMRINTAVSSANHARLDMDQRGLSSLSRASVHYYNTEAELDRFVGAVDEILRLCVNH